MLEARNKVLTLLAQINDDLFVCENLVHEVLHVEAYNIQIRHIRANIALIKGALEQYPKF